MALVHVVKLKIYLPFVTNLKEKRKIRFSLLDRFKRMNISAIEMADHNLQNHLVLLLSYSSLDMVSLESKRQQIMELVYEFSEHLVIEEETLALD